MARHWGRQRRGSIGGQLACALTRLCRGYYSLQLSKILNPAHMFNTATILSAAGVNCAPFRSFSGVFCSKANQLFGTYSALSLLRSSYRLGPGPPPYSDWEVHHVVEDQDLARLGIAGQFPPYQQQLCVILPRAAHVARINNILRNRNPSLYSATAGELLAGYKEAYELIGNYSGGGEALIRRELLDIVRAVFRLANAR